MSAKFKQTADGWNFRCPGCNDIHALTSAIWAFSGSLETPTVSPSVLVTSGHYAGGNPQRPSCWCTYNADQDAKGEPRAPFECRVCHSFVREGRIQFLNDCTHALAGQTVDLPDW